MEEVICKYIESEECDGFTNDFTGERRHCPHAVPHLIGICQCCFKGKIVDSCVPKEEYDNGGN